MINIVLASNTRKKIAELGTLLSSAASKGISVLALRDIGFTGDIVEDGESFEENALIKASVPASMGHIGRVDHPDMMPVYDLIGRKMKEHGKLFGVSMGFVPEVIKQWLARGAGMIFAGNDVGYVHDGAKAVLEGLRELSPEG